MAMLEQDVELLDGLLDGALGEAEALSLRERLTTDIELEAMLDRVRVDREHREAVWGVLEPSDAEVMGLVSRIRGATVIRRDRSRRIFRRVAAGLGVAGSLAACLGIGFRVGSHHADMGGAAARSPEKTSHGYQVALTDEAGRVDAVQTFDSLDKAREFTRDVGQWQERQRQFRDGAAVVVADRF